MSPHKTTPKVLEEHIVFDEYVHEIKHETKMIIEIATDTEVHKSFSTVSTYVAWWVIVAVLMLPQILPAYKPGIAHLAYVSNLLCVSTERQVIYSFFHIYRIGIAI